ncbi:MAG: UDP-2,3-diacylglucosamine diphosphatase [Rhodoferax sp.]
MNAVAVPDTTAHSVTPAPGRLQAPAHWQRVDFIADLHLQSSDGATFDAWRDYMRRTQADAVFILGDLFEVWVGDDLFDQGAVQSAGRAPDQGASLAACCAGVLQAAARRLSLYFIHGNRDFLLGPAYAGACGMTVLADPTALDFAGQRWLLSHGDALCLADTDYMRFRAEVRNEPWRQAFLAKPLAERESIGRGMRAQSEALKSCARDSGAMRVDLDRAATRDWLSAADASTLIHGHTHMPAEHDLGGGLRRLVLSDWDGDAKPPRASILRLHAGAGARAERLPAISA